MPVADSGRWNEEMSLTVFVSVPNPSFITRPRYCLISLESVIYPEASAKSTTLRHLPATMTLPKAQPWKAAWPPTEHKSTCGGIEYGVQKGEIVVVDGTAANVKPKAQPWKAAWPPAEQKACAGVEYGVAKGEVAVVDGTAANVKPVKKENK